MHKLFPAAVLIVSLAGCVPSPDEPLSGTDLSGAPIGGAFTLQDKDGKTVTWDQFKGKYRIVYFGYTFCPDVCPVDVAVLMRGLAKFEKQRPDRAAMVQAIFITVDPARDTPAVVGEFAANFSPRLLGLTGSQQQIDQAIKAFRVYVSKGAQSGGGYLVDHSRHAYLMDPSGQPIEVLPTDKGADAVASDLDIAVR